MNNNGINKLDNYECKLSNYFNEEVKFKKYGNC